LKEGVNLSNGTDLASQLANFSSIVTFIVYKWSTHYALSANLQTQMKESRSGTLFTSSALGGNHAKTFTAKMPMHHPTQDHHSF
jgi:hypothetical protein